MTAVDPERTLKVIHYPYTLCTHILNQKSQLDNAAVKNIFKISREITANPFMVWYSDDFIEKRFPIYIAAA
jgi:hypothetical protein